MNAADEGVKPVGNQRLTPPRGGQDVTPREASPVSAIRRLLPYGMAVAFVATALGLSAGAEFYALENLGFPFFLTAIAVTVWYAGAGPAALAIVLSALSYNYFFTEPRYTLYIESHDRPIFVVFVLFALLIGWFSSRRRRIEQQLRRARDELEVEVARACCSSRPLRAGAAPGAGGSSNGLGVR